MTVQPKIRIVHERTLADVARMALDGSETYQQAAERLLAMLTPDEMQRLLEPYEMSAALALIRATAGSFRRSVWAPPASQADRVAALARSNRASLLDFPLPGGLPLRAAGPAEVEAAAEFYREHAADMAWKGRWLARVRAVLRDGETVGDRLSAEELQRLQDETRETTK